MSNGRAAAWGFVGAVLAAVGLLALWFPVHLSQFDQWGMAISCGRGFNASPSQASENSDIARQCGHALLVRRVWAIPSAVAGWAILTVVALVWIRSEPATSEDSTRFWELHGDAT